MVKAELDRQLMIRVKDHVGTLSEVTHLISSSGINLVAICAYAVDNLVSVMFVTEDNNAARTILEGQNYHVQEDEVILLTIDNKPGALQTVTDKIAAAGIDLRLVYGSVEKTGTMSRIVMISKNNLDVMLLLKTEFERNS